MLLVLLLLAQTPEAHMVCTTTGGPITLNGNSNTTVPMKCCPTGQYVANPDKPTDAQGNLVCTKQENI
jgi:hypothetical protein